MIPNYIEMYLTPVRMVILKKKIKRTYKFGEDVKK
jgi:hypothetical protein